MPGWKIGRLLVVAVLAAGAAVAAGQYREPRRLPPAETAEPPIAPQGPITPVPPEEPLPPLVVEDPQVQPAQFSRPGAPTMLPTASPTPRSAAPPAATRPVADPPPPVVKIQVRVPADSPPDDDIKYILTVQNVSPSDAHAVTVRNPLPEGVVEAVKAEPAWDPKLSDPKKQLVWTFNTLKAGDVKKIELVLKPKKDTTEIRNLAYVRFEHGEQVTTRINRPAVKLTKTAPKDTVRDQPFTVRITVENTGRVAAEGVRVVEDVDRAAEVQAVTAGARRTKPDANQWQWEIPKLLPGERRVIEYRLTPRQAAEARTTTNVSAGKGVLETAESRTAVLVPGLKLTLSDPPGVVGPGEAAAYEVVVENAGTLPSTNVRVVATIPADCKVKRKTEGGQVGRDQVVWTVPRLDPGQAYSVRFALEAPTSGRRVVTATATDARKTTARDEKATVFKAAANLLWESVPDPAALAVGGRGTFTIRVRNTGGEAARNVKVAVDLPAAVVVVKTVPSVQPDGGKLTFGPNDVPANGSFEYAITYEAKQSAQAYFRLKLTADALGKTPLETEKSVEITGTPR